MHRLDFFPTNALINQYRQVFSSRAGRDVLAHLLFDLGVFQEISDGPEDVALKNFGLRLTKILAGGEPAPESVDSFMMKLMKQPLPKEQKNEGY